MGWETNINKLVVSDMTYSTITSDEMQTNEPAKPLMPATMDDVQYLQTALDIQSTRFQSLTTQVESDRLNTMNVVNATKNDMNMLHERMFALETRINTSESIRIPHFIDFKVEDMKKYYEEALAESKRFTNELMDEIQKLADERKKLISALKFEKDWEA